MVKKKPLEKWRIDIVDRVSNAVYETKDYLVGGVDDVENIVDEFKTRLSALDFDISTIEFIVKFIGVNDN